MDQTTTGVVGGGLTKDILLEMFSYEPVLGKLFWKERGGSTRSDSAFRHAGKEISSIDTDKNGYKRVRVKLFGNSYTVSRLIYTMHHGPFPNNLKIDHINRNPFDNRIENLRLATHAQNMMNWKSIRPTISGYKGVFRHRHKWKAECRMNGIRERAYGFSNPADAALAYDKMAQRIGGEYAYLNFPEKHSMSHGK